MININFLKETGIILRTYGKASSPLFSLDDGVTITNSYDIANTFNNFFESAKKQNKIPHKHFSDYLSNETSCTIFLESLDKEEITNIISSVNSNKGFWPK